MEKEHTHKEIELRSEEVQEVMNRVPAWILRSGITVLFIIVVVLVAGSYWFKYPDEVGGQAVLGRQIRQSTPWLTERHGYDPTSCMYRTARR